MANPQLLQTGVGRPLEAGWKRDFAAAFEYEMPPGVRFEPRTTGGVVYGTGTEIAKDIGCTDYRGNSSEAEAESAIRSRVADMFTDNRLALSAQESIEVSIRGIDYVLRNQRREEFMHARLRVDVVDVVSATDKTKFVIDPEKSAVIGEFNIPGRTERSNSPPIHRVYIGSIRAHADHRFTKEMLREVMELVPGTMTLLPVGPLAEDPPQRF